MDRTGETAMKPNISIVLWVVFLSLLASLLPHTAWAFDQFEPAEAERWAIFGTTATPVAWLFALSFETAIAALTHTLKNHIEARRKSSFNLERARYTWYLQWWPMFAYRYLNTYSAGLFAAWLLSTLANLAHAVEYGGSMAIFETWGIPSGFYALTFGAVLPTISLLFARVLSSVREAEQEDDPAFVRSKEELKEARATIREAEQRAKDAEQSIRLLEQRLNESEQRYKAFGDVVRYLFGQEAAPQERIRWVRETFPNLSQNGISQLLGYAVSTVNKYVVELPEDEVQR
jgi:hypothetical protein